jgi:cytochrome P450
MLVQDYFGVPGPDTPTLMRWMRALFQDLFLNLGSDAGVHERALEASRGLAEHFGDLIAAERRSPGRADTVLARLVRLSSTELALGDDAIRRSLSGVIVGAVDTTNKSFCQAFDQLLLRPHEVEAAQEAAARGDVEEVGRVIFEALRFDPHNPIIVRHCPAEVRIGREREYVVPAGSTLYAATLSAMFDPAAFDDPGAFRTDRETPSLHFGAGMHRCYGARINGVTLPELATALLTRPPVRRAGWLRGRIHHDGPFPDRLEVQFRNGDGLKNLES